jgi:hypothetical protein
MAIQKLRAQADPQAQRRRPDLRHQLLEGIGLVAEPGPELPVQPVRRSTPMAVMPTSA